MLHIENLSFEYNYQPVFAPLNLQVLPGTLLHLKGKNGSGKTTILKLIAGLIPPATGTICFNNHLFYRHEICYVSHKPGLSASLSLYENYCLDANYQVNKTNFAELLAQFKLSAQQHTLFSLLSAGQKRRATLLRLGLTSAKIWLLDEPFVALDSQAISHLIDLIKKHLANQGIVILACHQSLEENFLHYHEYLL